MWIETLDTGLTTIDDLMSRLARALWIETSSESVSQYRRKSRGSREPCGLKRNDAQLDVYTLSSRLARALWIETCFLFKLFTSKSCRGSREPCGLKHVIYFPSYTSSKSRLARALWIETSCIWGDNCCGGASRLARALWIETLEQNRQQTYSGVEARESLVD